MLGAALRTAGVVTGGPEGEELLREAVATLDGAGVALESARALVDLGLAAAPPPIAAPRRGSCCAKASTSPIAAGAARVADQAETELRATGARPRRAHC